MSDVAPTPPADEPEDPWMGLLRRNREALQRMREALEAKEQERIILPGIPCE